MIFSYTVEQSKGQRERIFSLWCVKFIESHWNCKPVNVRLLWKPWKTGRPSSSSKEHLSTVHPRFRMQDPNLGSSTLCKRLISKPHSGHPTESMLISNRPTILRNNPKVMGPRDFWRELLRIAIAVRTKRS